MRPYPVERALRRLSRKLEQEHVHPFGVPSRDDNLQLARRLHDDHGNGEAEFAKLSVFTSYDLEVFGTRAFMSESCSWIRPYSVFTGVVL